MPTRLRSGSCSSLLRAFGAGDPRGPHCSRSLAVALFALPVNLWVLRERGAAIRTESDFARARLAAIEIEREIIGGGPIPVYSDQGVIPTTGAAYLAAVDRFGSFGYSTAELAAAPEEVRTLADETLGAIVTPALEPAPVGAVSCSGGGPVELERADAAAIADRRCRRAAAIRRCPGGRGGDARARRCRGDRSARRSGCPALDRIGRRRRPPALRAAPLVLTRLQRRYLRDGRMPWRWSSRRIPAQTVFSP